MIIFLLTIFHFFIQTISQVVIVDELFDKKLSNMTHSEIFSNEGWDNEINVAVYGWIKIKCCLEQSDRESQIFYLSNSPLYKIQTPKSSSSVLQLKVIQSQNLIELHFPTYSINQNSDQDQVYMLELNNQEIFDWIFFYIAYSGEKNQMMVIFKQTNYKHTIYFHNIEHTKSDFYQINVGKNPNTHPFLGIIFRLTLFFGQGAYLENLMDLDSYFGIIPDYSTSCVSFFSKSNYIGKSYTPCQEDIYLNLEEYKSIYVPQNMTIDVIDYQLPENLQKLKFLTSIEKLEVSKLYYLIQEGKIKIIFK